MITMTAMRLGKCIAVAMLLSSAHAVAAQEVVVRGRVLGPDSAPLASDRVVLHRVDQSGGATIAEGPTQPDGTFTLTAPASADTSGVYFLAARYEGELYIGQPFRASASIPEQTLQVGVASSSASAMLSEASGPPPPTMQAPPTRNWWWLLLPLLAVGAAVIYFVVPRRRVTPERALLIRIAEIDERIAGAPPGQRDSLLQERSYLVEQLRTG